MKRFGNNCTHDDGRKKKKMKKKKKNGKIKFMFVLTSDMHVACVYVMCEWLCLCIVLCAVQCTRYNLHLKSVGLMEAHNFSYVFVGLNL